MTDKKAVEVLKDLWSHEHSGRFTEKEIREALAIAILKVGRGSGKTSLSNILAGLLISMKKGEKKSEI